MSPPDLSHSDAESAPTGGDIGGSLGGGGRRRLRLAAIIAGGAGLVFVLGLALGATLMQGPRLARVVTGFLPAFAGKIDVASIRWRPRLFWDLLTDAPTPIVIEGLRVTDPEGKDVLRAPRLEAKVRPRSAMSARIYLHDVKLGPGSFWRFARMGEREGIGFLRWFEIPDEPGAPRPPPPPKQDPDETEFVFQIVNVELDGLTALFDFPGAWGLELRDIKAPGTVLVEGDFVGFDVKNLVARKGGYLRILDDVLPFDRVEVNRVATTRDQPDNIQLDVAAGRTGASVLVGKGVFTGIYGYGVPEGALEPPSGIKMHVEISEAADALAAAAGRRNIEGLRISGKGARVSADLSDVFESLDIKGELSGLDVAYGSNEARQLQLRFATDLGEPMSVLLERLQFQAPGGGAFDLNASLRGPKAEARLSFDRFTTDSYLPKGLRKLAAGRLHGGLQVSADLEQRGVGLSGMKLELRRRFPGKAPRTIQLLGEASATPQVARTERVVLKVPGATVTASGRFGVARQVLGLGLRAVASDLPKLLATLGLPPFGRSADLRVDVGGTVMAPTARGSLLVRGVGLGTLPPIGAVDARFRLQDGTAHLDSLTGDAFGGRIEARGTAQLFRGTLARMLASPLLDLTLAGRRIDLATLVAGGAVTGRLDVDARVQGPADAPQGTIKVPGGATLVVLGEKWRLEGVEIVADARGAVLKRGRLVRPAGGELELTGRMAWDGPMQWQIKARALPLEALPGIKGGDVPVAGRLALDLQVTGTPSAPLLNGQLDLSDVVARGVRLGKGTVRFSPTPEGGVAVDGQLFGRISLAGTAQYGAGGPRVKAIAEFRELVLEELVPEVRQFGDARGKLSGRVQVDWGGGQPLALELRLRQLELSAARAGAPARDSGGQSARRFFLRNASEIRVAFAGTHLIVDRTRLVTDGGEFKLWGEMRDERVTGEIDGSLNLELLQPFVADRVESLSGAIDFAMRVAGTPRRPLGEGQLVIARPLSVRLPGVGPAISVPSGVVKLSPAAVDLRNLVFEAEGARLTVAGRAGFDARQNVSDMDVSVGGELSGALLEAFAGAVVSEARGKAQLSARLRGTPEAPQVNARLRPKGLAFRLRELGRELSFEGGEIALTSDRLTLQGVEARIDGYGRLVIGGDTPGRVAIRRLSPFELGDIRVPVSGRRLSLRVSEAVEVEDVGVDLTVQGNPTSGLALEGQVLIASGRYMRDFTMRNLVISPNIDESDVQTPGEGNPLVDNMKLHLRVRTVGDSFMVKNNLAPELHASVDLLVRGTVSSPLIAGEIRPTDGRFHIPAIRGDFELLPNVNHITFVDTKSIERGETPELNLEAESIVVDSANREHRVRMRISGPLGQAQIDLSTSNTGLDRNQALLLLLSGRTSEQEAVFGGTANPTLGANARTGSDVIDQLARDSVADFLEPYIDDTLQSFTGGLVNLRPSVGPDGFELRLEARRGRRSDIQLSLLRGLENRRQYRAAGSFWIADYLTVRGLWEQLTYTPQEGILEPTKRMQVELGVDFPIRFR